MINNLDDLDSGWNRNEFGPITKELMKKPEKDIVERMEEYAKHDEYHVTRYLLEEGAKEIRELRQENYKLREGDRW